MKPFVQQRLRITFAKGEEIKYISHLDLMRLWERALRRAEIPLAYSHGFHPRPKMAIAAPLPVGFTSRGEVMDIFLTHPVSPLEFIKRLKPHLPSGLAILSVEEVAPKSPSLQSQVRWADYRVAVTCGNAREEMERRLQGLLSAEHLLRWRRNKEYDLRPLIEGLRIERKTQRGWLLGMRLRTGSEGTGRPDEVLKELGLYDGAWAIQREQLLFSSGISSPPRMRER
ncbi:MAG: TIGR03936 family radical SAM-associated protein [Chloroflexota bacterium]|nr:TIGR03936 family radical SAM-associated protein [Chloroflexota bacterium]